jgi:ZIP family zinc transporter/zinc and cadmium transporter
MDALSSELTYGLLFSTLAAAGNLLGGAVLTAKTRWDTRFLHTTLALGSGFMLAATVLKMIPASLEAESEWIPLMILAGYLLVQAAEHTVSPHFHFGEETHLEVMLGSKVGISALVGLMVHTFFDGVSIGAGFAVSSTLGLLIFVAVVLHKMPEGFTMASIVLASGGNRRLALGSAGVLGLATVLGALLAGSLAGPHVRYALAVSAGVTLYVAASDLVPEVNNAHGINSSLLLFVGVALFWITEHLLHLLGVP